MLSIDEVKKIALLSRIELKEEEIAKFQTDLSSVLDYVELLKEVNTGDLEIVSSVTGLENVMREDKPVLIEDQNLILQNAPESKDGYYKVKSIFS